MKKYVLVVLALLGLVVPVNAAFFVAGDFNGWNASGNVMTDNMDGTHSVSLSNVAGRHEFKVTQGDWSWNYPGPNSWFYGDGSGNVTITFNTNTVLDGWNPGQYRIGLSTDPGTWTVAGSFQGWSNNNPATAMTAQGGGVYMLSQTLAAGEYWFKPVVTGSWDSISDDGRNVNTNNMYLNLAADSVVNIYVDALVGKVKAEVVPEPATMALFAIGSLFLARRKK
ncbi:MAG: PEP-CTERM sorting domain-containing protein [Planctomycetes bacterium]|nr:PEP-CTERM sorting domain-containing protein [Planctomycetota bacterium]